MYVEDGDLVREALASPGTVDVNAPDKRRCAAAIEATERGRDAGIVKQLLDGGADPASSVPMACGDGPLLHFAVRSGNVEAACWALFFKPWGRTERRGDGLEMGRAVYTAAFEGWCKILKMLLDGGVTPDIWKGSRSREQKYSTYHDRRF